jgi:uncharacterized protein (TIGR01244 family)
MKRVAMACIALVLLSVALASAADPALRIAAKVEGFANLFQTGDFFIAGQPTLEELRWFKSAGVTLVINIRSEAESKDFTATAFNEENIVKELGLAYALLPIREKESFSPRTVDSFAALLSANKGRVVLHCASAGRATNLWMAYLVRHRGFDVDDAALVGRQIKFTLPFEDFLGGRILSLYPCGGVRNVCQYSTQRRLKPNAVIDIDEEDNDGHGNEIGRVERALPRVGQGDDVPFEVDEDHIDKNHGQEDILLAKRS